MTQLEESALFLVILVFAGLIAWLFWEILTDV